MSETNGQQVYRTIDKFDRALGALIDLPDVAKVKPATVQTVIPVTGEAQTYIVRTLRQKEIGETIFVEYGDGEKYVRIFFPPAVSKVIYAQREALVAKVKRDTGRRVGKEQAALRKDRGELPAFMKGKKKSRASSAAAG